MKKFGEKSEKCRRDVEATRKLYKQSLDELNASNARYVEDMTEVYRRTQDFEEKRLKFFKKFLYDMHACLDLTQKKTLVGYVYFNRRSEIGVLADVGRGDCPLLIFLPCL